MARLDTYPQFLELLPFYVNGTLDADTRAAVDAFVADNPRAESELALHRAFGDAVRADVPPVSADVGLQRTLARIAARRPASAAASPSRLATWWHDWLQSWKWTPALATMWVLAIVQGAVLTALIANKERPYAEMRGTGAAGSGAVLQVMFRPDVPERELRVAVQNAGARIVDGPNELGFYFVAVPTDRATAALDALRADPAVQDARPAPGKRP